MSSWAALFHDAGKAETTHWEYKRGRMAVTSAGHDTAGEKLALRVFDRLKIHAWNGADVRDLALRLIRTHHRAAELWNNRTIVTKKAFNRFAADTGGEFELAADRARGGDMGRTGRAAGVRARPRGPVAARVDAEAQRLEGNDPSAPPRAGSSEAERPPRSGHGQASQGSLPTAAG